MSYWGAKTVQRGNHVYDVDEAGERNTTPSNRTGEREIQPWSPTAQ